MIGLAGQAPLYDRRIRLEVTPYQAPTGRAYGNLGKGVAPLRCQFSIQRTLQGNADKAKITLTNLAEATRNALGKNARVVLTAGYAARSGLLFQGFVDKIKSQQQGPDIMTEMECADGQINIQYATVSRVYAEPVTLARVLQDLASDLSLTLDGQILEVAPGIIKGIPNKTFARGLTLDGPVAHWLDLYLRAQKIDWSIQNGRLIIIPRNVTTSISPCVALSSQTGMLDTPSFSDKGLVVSSLLNSDILPGRLLQVTSKSAETSGFFKAVECTYEGDTHDMPWRVQSVCDRVEGEITALPLAPPTDFAKAVV